jgi:hypothetical protein
VVGDERDAVETGNPRQRPREREVTVGDDHALDAERAQFGDAGLDGPVEAVARRGDDPHAVGARPVGDGGVVAHDGGRQRRRDREHVLGHLTCETRSFGCGERGCEPALGVGERLHGHEHRDATDPLHRRRGYRRTASSPVGSRA